MVLKWTKRYKTIGIFYFWVFAHTVKIWKERFCMKQVLVFGKMELPLCDYTQCEVCSVIWFLAAAGWTKAAIHKELKRVYGTDVMTTMVGRWVKQFEEGRADVNTERTSRHSESMPIENIQQLCDLLEEDCRMTVSELCFRLQVADCTRTSMYKIVHDILGFCKLASCWVPHLLTKDHKKVEWVWPWNFCRHMRGRVIFNRTHSYRFTTAPLNLSNKVWCRVSRVNLHPKKRKWVILLIRLWRQFFRMSKAFSSSNTIRKVLMWIDKHIRRPWRNYVLLFAACIRYYEMTKSSLSTIMPDRIRQHPFKNSFVHVTGIFSGIRLIHRTSHSATSSFLSWRENLGVNVSEAMKKSNMQ